MASKKRLGVNVLEAAKSRIDFVMENFPKVIVSVSGGKDSTVMLHLAADSARKIGRKIIVMFIDLEAQYDLTIKHLETLRSEYQDCCEFHWVCLPLSLRNAVSAYEPQWICWDGRQKDRWVREMPRHAIREESAPHWFVKGMEFEDFVDRYSDWLSEGDLIATLVGIRTDESLNRYRAIANNEYSRFEGLPWTTWKAGSCVNVYPIYDWRTKDIWVYHGKTGKPYNKLYDLMNQAGLSIHQQRICQPYGDDQRKGLWLYQIIEPETWAKVVARVNGANSGALYARESGNINGTIKVKKPQGHTWESFAEMLLASMPKNTRDHYQIKINTFIDWWADEYPDGIPDEADPALENGKKAPSWRRICKTLLRNDYWCKGLSFTQHKSGAYEAYLRLKKQRYGL